MRTAILLSLLLLVLIGSSRAFVPQHSRRAIWSNNKPLTNHHHQLIKQPQPFSRYAYETTTTTTTTTWNTLLQATLSDDDDENEREKSSPGFRRSMGRRLRNLLQPVSRRFVDKLASVSGSIKRRRRILAFALALSSSTGAVNLMLPSLKEAHAASAPVMAMPKAEDRDPATEALGERERQLVQQEQDELNEFAKRGREIEASQGERARIQFEKDYKAQQVADAKARVAGLEQLKRDLLDQGICPFTDMEGKRQVILYEKGVDLADVSGTPFNLEREYQERAPKKSEKVQKAANRAVIACMVQDMKNRGGIDPLEYFEKRQEQTYDIMDMPAPKAAALVQEYRANLEEYGSITKPAPGEQSVKEKMAAAATKDPKAAKQEAQRLKALAKAEQKAEKQRLKEEKKAKKEAEKAAKLAQKQADKAAAEKAAAEATTAAAASAASGDEIIEEGDEVVSTLSEGEEGAAAAVAPSAPTSEVKKTEKSKTPIVKAASVVIAAGGGAYAIQMYRNKKAADEEERQRQFRLLMDGANEGSSDDDDDEEVDGGSAPASSPASATIAPPPPAPAPTPSPKRRLGFFGKKKNNRETDLNMLVSSPDATAPAFAWLLAQILTYGAPGRFPDVVAMLGGPEKLPMDEFDLDLAKQLLVEARTKAGLEQPSEYAEIFANVVNCMLIDIVDLASTSLKEKETQKTVDAINIVVDFMNHAASLYDAVAGGVTITPVTYGGTLKKAQLEQMYSAYAVSGMSNMENMPDDFDSRVGLLQDVFDINAKKAEGLMMKALQKNMMEMMKSGEGMEELMKGMGGMEGMEGLMGGAGMGGEGAETDPEQLKAMLTELKRAKDAGEITKKDLGMVKDMFKSSFGMSMDDLMNSEDISEEDKEVLDLMKEVLYD